MHSKETPKSGASLIILYTDDYKILLQDRTGISKWGEDWACFGGALELGETCDDALVREIKEELNYDIKEFYLYLSLQGEDSQYNWYYKNITKDLDKLTVLEGAGMKLFSFDEIKELNIIQRQKDRILEFENFLKKNNL